MDFFLLVVVFILDVSHNGFHQVLHSDKALGASVFVHDNSHLGLAGGHFRKQLAAPLGFRNKAGAPHHVGKLGFLRHLGADIF